MTCLTPTTAEIRLTRDLMRSKVYKTGYYMINSQILHEFPTGLLKQSNPSTDSLR